MQVPYYVVHAFTSTVFAGNPAGVCVLEDWLPDDRMQRIAAENRLSETAFLLGGDARYELRWFIASGRRFYYFARRGPAPPTGGLIKG